MGAQFKSLERKIQGAGTPRGAGISATSATQARQPSYDGKTACHMMPRITFNFYVLSSTFPTLTCTKIIRNLAKIQIDSGDLGWGLRVCISPKLLGDAKATGPWAMPWVSRS